MTTVDRERVRAAVQERYATAARTASCCGSAGTGSDVISNDLYRPDQAGAVPAAALAASLGCGNPTMLADLRPGQIVLDLGSGGGIDVLLSARRVGPAGKAYGLDMTPEMLDLARRNQRAAGVANAEFLEGTIEDVPLPDASVDVIISNCVINLSTDKDAVFVEAYRVLRPGGRLAVSDIVLRRPLPDSLTQVMALWTGCLAGALLESEYESKLRAAGFVDISIEPTRVYDRIDLDGMAGDLTAPAGLTAPFDREAAVAALDGATMSAFVRAGKPAG